ncbi:MAG: sigma-54-dependent transcriptional regulator [bacterium]
MSNNTISVLIVDDDINYRNIITGYLKNQGYDTIAASSGEEAIEHLKNYYFHIVVSDLKLPGISGIDLLKTIKSKTKESEVIILTGFGSIDSAVSALKIGAYDYLVKPLSLEELSLTIKRLVENINLKTKADYFKREISKKYFIGKSKAAQKIIDDISLAAKSDINVLILGESGTGKELSANLLHRLSDRADNPLIIVDSCNLSENLFESELFGHERGSFTGADILKKGLLEYADKGILFIDEIGEISNIIQSKLLRIIDTKSFRRVGSSKNIQIDTRVITATNKNLRKMIEENKFRGDLYYRISGFIIELPPLRDRKEDIPYLTHFFMTKKNKINTSKMISSGAIDKLLSYDWPGNVRELKNVIERAIVLSDGKDNIMPENIQVEAAASNAGGKINNADFTYLFDSHISLNEIEEKYIRYLLRKGFSKSEIADITGISERNLYRKIALIN